MVDTPATSPHPDTLERVRKLVAETAGKDVRTIGDDCGLTTDLHFDSLDNVGLLFGLEDEFDIDIADEQIAPVETVSQLAAFVDAAIGQRTKRHG